MKLASVAWIVVAASIAAGCGASAMEPRVSYRLGGRSGEGVLLLERRADREREYLVICDMQRTPPCVRVAPQTMRSEELRAWMQAPAASSRPADAHPADAHPADSHPADSRPVSTLPNAAPAGGPGPAAPLSPRPTRALCEGPECGRLRLWADPWCDVEVEGESLGRTPVVDYPLEPGIYRTRCVNPEVGIEQEFGVRIAPNTTTRLLIGLGDARPAARTRP